MSLTINGTPIKTPDHFSIERYNLTKAGRLASGKMTLELIAKKRKFQLEYNILSGSELNNILSLIDSSSMFFTLGYTENSVAKTAVCYAGAIPSTLYRSDVWQWTDVTFSLIEQ
ncbi:hypothetical protein [Paenibacillus abyssi]|uniref:Uncharacterized protein n=1 Tax=Paenibacillus abyssi TaxID=1340531 RepID=A0A917FK37_9BACL|nr:hypothetical protein [Paenibacillus abyssi]GGF88526.1 hypothetical protein GCM10010916_02350 [Paenibacillus abyssi]